MATRHNDENTVSLAQLSQFARQHGDEFWLGMGHNRGCPGVLDPEQTVAIPTASRSSGILIMGQPGSGKTHCMEMLLVQAMARGETVVVIDRFGDPRLREVVDDSVAFHGIENYLCPKRIMDIPSFEDETLQLMAGGVIYLSLNRTRGKIIMDAFEALMLQSRIRSLSLSLFIDEVDCFSDRLFIEKLATAALTGNRVILTCQELPRYDYARLAAIFNNHVILPTSRSYPREKLHSLVEDSQFSRRMIEEIDGLNNGEFVLHTEIETLFRGKRISLDLSSAQDEELPDLPKNGLWMLESDGQPVAWSPFEKKTNGCTVLTGKAKTGKTTIARHLADQLLQRGVSTWIISHSSRDYNNLRAADFVHPHTLNTGLNPFLVTEDWQESGALFTDLVESMGALEKPLGKRQRKKLEELLRDVCQRTGPYSTMDSVITLCQAASDSGLKALGDNLEPYRPHGEYGYLLRGNHALADTYHRGIITEFPRGDLPKSVYRVLILNLLYQIHHAAIARHDEPFLVIIDDLWPLFSHREIRKANQFIKSLWSLWTNQPNLALLAIANGSRDFLGTEMIESADHCLYLPSAEKPRSRSAKKRLAGFPVDFMPVESDSQPGDLWYYCRNAMDRPIKRSIPWKLTRQAGNAQPVASSSAQDAPPRLTLV